MAAGAPTDKFHAVWWIFLILGVGTLLPWNFFMTATTYFVSRLKVWPNETAAGEEPRGVLEARFSNVMTLCAMLPLLIFTCLNSFLHSRVPQRVRVAGSLLVIMVVFLLTALLVKVPMDPPNFFLVTMVKIVIINSFGAVLQGSLFGMAAALPASYTTPIMSGQGLAGTFAAFAMICAIASGRGVEEVAFGYFITACLVISLSICSYFMLPKLEFFQFHEHQQERRQEEGEDKVNLASEADAESGEEAVSMVKIFRKIWVLALSVCFIFTITIGTFPAVAADTKSTLGQGSSWDVYFVPVACFLLFNLCDWGGRSLTAFCTWPGEDSRLLPVLIVARVAFVPLFMLCNVQPRLHLPVYFQHDAFFAAFMVAFAITNGYLASLCMCFGPKRVLPHEAETAGAIMAFFLSLGLALGAAMSFLFRVLV
ncbi:equilibrative nucleoside transporter 1-like isoform X1 [Entelurus aequoreus]|uniref:equilibrative nucleoside transporter 1-like isoform X1 n=2 Tax=Entelurus aequoreus TaxID=161455 RepID=UPI002B1D6EF7|nr:equilibrative nucleoside transporter 1-like isoform X1 [Entelurus aequoreus]